MKKLVAAALLSLSLSANAQKKQFTETDLWNLKYANGLQTSQDGKKILYSIRTYNLGENKGQNDLYLFDVATKSHKRITETPFSENGACWDADGIHILYSATDRATNTQQIFRITAENNNPEQVSFIDGGVNEFRFSGNGQVLLYSQDVKVRGFLNEKYPDLPKTSGRDFSGLMMRHWNEWEDEFASHLFFIRKNGNSFKGIGEDLMAGEQFDFPMKPHDGFEQLDITNDGKLVAFAVKKLIGTDAAKSTNSEIYIVNLETKETSNVSEPNPGYDKEPKFSPDGNAILWLSMERGGFEADLNRIMIRKLANGKPVGPMVEAYQNFEYNAHHPVWKNNGKIYFTVEFQATIQLYTIELAPDFQTPTKLPYPITLGNHNYNDFTIAGPKFDQIFGLKSTLLTPNELYHIDAKGNQVKVSTFNDEYLAQFETPVMEMVKVKATDGKEIYTWVVRPQGDEARPALLLCQGGPQSMVGQGFSMRWNTRVMAGHGYVVLYPNRRGLPGFGKAWNEQVSGDWGGQAMKDLLSVTDHFKSAKYVNKDKMGAVGASFGGYSVYWLAGNHDGRFKAFIAHCGIFNTESMYGSTEEMFFSDWDSKGPYWEMPKNPTYTKFSPHLYVQNWNTPILVIHNDKDYRVPLEQGLMAFTAAQMRGIPSKFLNFPDEGHWVTKPQNSVAWNREFFSWLDMYLK